MGKHAVIFGAGNVGRGFLGQLFSESGYEVIFVDIDEPLIAALNERRSYTIRLVDNEQAEEVLVSPVRALHAEETEAVAQALAEASLAATAVGVRALPHIAPLVAAGIVQRTALSRFQVPGSRLQVNKPTEPAPPQAGPASSELQTFEPATLNPLNIIVCENMKKAAATFRCMVGEHLPADHQQQVLENVGFVDTVIARMVPPPTPEMRAQDPSLIVVEPYKELPVDRSGFVGPIPEIVGLEPCDRIALYTDRKLYLHNCGHAMLAYLGYQRGHEYGYQALEDPVIRPLLKAMLAESKAGIVVAHSVEAQWLEPHIADIVRRLANRALGDTIFRLARDPLRKLGPEDRLVGAARLAERAGVVTKALSWGIAAGYCFDDGDDPLAMALQQRIAAEGVDAVIADVSGIAPDEPLAALVRERYRRIQQGDWP